MTAIKTELKARDVMTADPVCVEPSTGIRELARTLEEHEISGAPVVDQQGRVVGVVSKTDLIRRCSEGSANVEPAYLFEVLFEQAGEDEEDGPANQEVIPEPVICVEDFMTEDPVMVSPEASAAMVAKLMFEGRIHRVIVADEAKFPLGIITSLDLLGVFSQ
jgi:CBS domain-containing protein